jgi:aromatic ring hydroxylase
VAGAGGGGRGDPELQKRLSEMQQEVEAYRTELDKTREDAQRSQVEMERLLQLVQMSQEEQNTKEKMIRDLQEYVSGCKQRCVCVKYMLVNFLFPTTDLIESI